jgi:hypothetical protein
MTGAKNALTTSDSDHQNAKAIKAWRRRVAWNAAMLAFQVAWSGWLMSQDGQITRWTVFNIAIGVLVCWVWFGLVLDAWFSRPR